MLLDGTNRNFMVHTSRRDQPGLAEIHTLDTDIIYVMEGNATIVTGGTAVETKEIAPNELRGSRIEGGDTRQLSKGQVIVIPNGVPHWFKQVGGDLSLLHNQGSLTALGSCTLKLGKHIPLIVG